MQQKASFEICSVEQFSPKSRSFWKNMSKYVTVVSSFPSLVKIHLVVLLWSWGGRHVTLGQPAKPNCPGFLCRWDLEAPRVEFLTPFGSWHSCWETTAVKAMDFQVICGKAENLGLKLLKLDPGHPNHGNPDDPDTFSEEITMMLLQLLLKLLQLHLQICGASWDSFQNFQRAS